MPLDKKKLNKLLVNIVIKLVKKTIPVIMNMAYEAGIENLAKLKEEVKLPDFCLPIPILEKMLAIRNSLIDELNIVDKQIKTIVQPVDNLNPKLDDAQTVLDIANTAIPIGETALGFFVSPPGAPGAAITSLFVAKTAVGIAEPIVMEIKNVINVIKSTSDQISGIILIIIGLLNSIDAYLKKCGISQTQLKQLSPSLQTLVNISTSADSSLGNVNPSQTYKGFNLKVVKEPFSSTVNRLRGVAYNTANIKLLQTEASFTTNPYVLINELKLIIDRDNLKAN